MTRFTGPSGARTILRTPFTALSMKTLRAALLAGSLVLPAGCTDFLDVNTNPNAPQVVTANGINHPNDFGHQVYAQVILALLTRVENPPSAPTFTTAC